MIEKITEEELQVLQMLTNPISASEVLFSDLDNLSLFEEDKTCKIRPYQYNFLSYDTCLMEDDKKSKKENFELKRGAAETYAMGGRLTGKSRIAIVVDAALATLNKSYNEGVLSSYDADHVKNQMERLLVIFEFHPVFKSFLNAKCKRNPYEVRAKNGCLLESVNDNILGKDPGHHWFSKHADRNWCEEASFLTKEVTGKQLMAQSELGMIRHWSGMTTFSKLSPLGEIFYEMKNKPKIVNLPSYVNPSWDDKKDKEAQLEFGGKNSPGYLVQILGKVIENSETVFDIERVRETYIKDIPIKAFEVNRNNYFRYKEILILDRPKNCETAYMCFDVGEGGAPTEIIIIFKINNKYVYTYNISTFKLSHDEDYELIDFVIELVQANMVGIDITSGGGKAIQSRLDKKYNGHIFGVAFNEKIEIDFDKDETGAYKTDNKGEYLFKYESNVDWSIHRLKHLFYTKAMKCFMDYKLDQQIDGVIVKTGKNKTLFGYKTVNHLFQAFQVFAIVEWKTEFKNIQPVQTTIPTRAVFGTI